MFTPNLKFSLLFYLLSCNLNSQDLSLDELISLSALSPQKVDSLLQNHSFVYTRTCRDTIFYNYYPATYSENAQKYSIFKIKSIVYCKGDFIYPRKLIKNLKDPDIDEFEDRVYWHFLYKEHYLSLKFNKIDNSFLLRIARI